MPSSHEWLTYMEWAKEMNMGATHFARSSIQFGTHHAMRWNELKRHRPSRRQTEVNYGDRGCDSWRARRRLIHTPHALLRATHNAGEDGIKSGLWHIVAFTVRHHIFIARNAKAEAMIRATEKLDY
ncbi:hypothetical protein K525DRAFT_271451 [Schizophyllum commune Loenen D]|nr:hypothetical protein K525DRAFT_271451 [Schizophyllum commune Loenen D]